MSRLEEWRVRLRDAIRRKSLARYGRGLFRRFFWEAMADEVHERWGSGTDDWPGYTALLDRHRPASILDVGCGSGRLFGLYLQKGVRDVVGVDISAKALRLARRRHPQVRTIRSPLESMRLDRDCDLAISNQVLSHVHPSRIAAVVRALCARCRMVWLDELVDPAHQTDFRFAHDWPALFAAHGFVPLERNVYPSGSATMLFGRPGPG